MARPNRLDLAQLEARMRVVRELAKALVRDPSDAEDLEQQVWLAAVARPPREGFAWVPWVSGVLANLRSKLFRERERRARRERAAARQEAVPSALDASAELEVARRLLAAVQALEGPLRTTITLRFLERQPPRVIALRMGVPIATVRTRIQRALERLRERLDHGDAGWRVALAPLAAAGRGEGLALALSAPVKAKLLAALLGCAALVLGWLALVGGVGSDVAVARRGSAATGVGVLAAATTQPSEPQTQPLSRAAVTSAPGWIVRGRAQYLDERPVPNARVRGELFAGYEATGAPSESADLRADERGEMSWPLARPVGAVTLRLHADAPGCYGVDHEVLVLAGDEAPQDVEVSLVLLDATVVGSVVDESLAKIAGARVRAGTQEAKTDAKGRFAVRVGSLGEHAVLTAVADGFAMGFADVRLLGGKDAQHDFVLRKEARVAGFVRDENGALLAGVTVRALRSAELAAVSDAAGAYSLAHLDPTVPECAMLLVREKGFYWQEARLGLAAPCTRHDFTLTRGMRLSGLVVDGGQALAGARVEFRTKQAGPFAVLDALTRDDGRFAFECVPPGRHELSLQRRGFVPRSLPVEVGRPGATDPVVRLERGTRLDGLVTDAEGQGLRGVWIDVRDPGRAAGWNVSTRSDARGQFVIDGLPREGGQILLRKRGYSYANAIVAADGARRTFVLDRCGTIAGRVVDGPTGKPLQRFKVRLVMPKLLGAERQGIADWGTGRWFEGADGRWSSSTAGDLLALGSVIGVEVSADGYAPVVGDHVVAAADPDPEGCVLTLWGGATVRGRVVADPSGLPLAGATVTLVHPALAMDTRGESPHAYTVRTDRRGEFAIAQAPRGAATLRVAHADWPTHDDGPFDVPAPGQSVERVVRLGAGGVLEGTVFDRAGAPVPHAELAVRYWDAGRPEAEARPARADAQGRFRIDRLRAGIHALAHVERRGTLEATLFLAQAELGAGTTRLDLRPAAGGGTLRLFVTRAGVPVELAAVSAGSLDPGVEQRRSWGGFVVNGICELRGLPANGDRYVVQVAGAMAPRLVTIRGEEIVELAIDLPQ